MLTFAIFVAFFILVGYIWRIRDKRKYMDFPPGPPRLPLLGSLPFIPQDPLPAVGLAKLGILYGDVVHVKMGFVDVVVFNSFETVKAVLNEDKASGRAVDFVASLRKRVLEKNIGIMSSSGEPWEVLSPFTIRSLRNFGFGKSATMDVITNEELDKLFEQIHSEIKASPGKGIQAEGMFQETLTHIMWRLVTGKTYKYGNPKMKQLLRISDLWIKNTSVSFDITLAYPFLWNMFPNWSRKNVQIKCVQGLHEFIRETIREHRESGVYNVEPQCYLDLFLEKIDSAKGDPNSYFNDDNLLLCLLDLFQGGGETSSKTLSFSVLYMLVYQNIQENVRKEIDSFIGKDEMITTEMKTRLPYTYATLLEILRYSTAVPFPPPRMAMEDFYFKGYLIKKGMPLLINLQSAQYAESVWGDPYNFRPERFLSKNGAVDFSVAKNLCTFGAGKRVCLGKGLAESSIFIYFATMIRSFKLNPVPGQPEPIMEPIPGATNSPHPFKVQFIPR